MARTDKGHRKVFIECDAVVARSDSPYDIAGRIKHLVSMARYRLSFNLKAYALACQSGSFLGGKRILAYKFWLVHLHKHSQSGFKGRNVLVQLIAIQRQSGLKTEGVAASKPTGLHASLDQHVPKFTNPFIRGIYLKAVLTCITCTAYNDVRVAIVYLPCLKCIEVQPGTVHAKHIPHTPFGIRALHGNLAVYVAFIFNRHIECAGM